MHWRVVIWYPGEGGRPSNRKIHGQQWVVGDLVLTFSISLTYFDRRRLGLTRLRRMDGRWYACVVLMLCLLNGCYSAKVRLCSAIVLRATVFLGATYFPLRPFPAERASPVPPMLCSSSPFPWVAAVDNRLHIDSLSLLYSLQTFA